MYFECSVRYDKTLENGSVKRSTEKYLVDAVSFTEAEATIIDQLSPRIGGEFTIPSIKKTKIAEIFNRDADKFFLAKAAFFSIDEKTGAERKALSQMLVGGSDYDDAKTCFEEGMQDTLSDFELLSLSETGIVEVFAH